MQFDVVIIGGGIIGFSTAMQLLTAEPHLKVAVIEKEPRAGLHQTGHNSGVIHAGVYYKPNSLKSQFCKKGAEQIKEFCTTHNIPYQVPGKLVVATQERELKWMENLITRCKANQLSVEILTAAEVKKLQSGIFSVGGFLVKETGIVNWQRVCEKYAELFQRMGGRIFFQETVMAIKETAHNVQIKTKNNQYEASCLISCGGLYADRLVRLSGLKAHFKIIPFRGEYYKLNNKMSYQNNIRYLIYPIPNPELPFLGVHFTRQITGEITVGPNAILALAREGYHWGKFNFLDCWETLSYLPFWKNIGNHFSAFTKELYGSLSKKYYVNLAKQYFPNIHAKDLISYPAGVRAQAINEEGKMVEDFLFIETERMIHTGNAPSPGATSSLPIGHYLVEKIIQRISNLSR